MSLAVLVMCLIALFVMSGALPSMNGTGLPTAVYSSPVMFALLFGLGVLLVWGCWRRRGAWNVRRLGFLAAHLGCVLLLTGAGIGLFLAKGTRFYAPVTGMMSDVLPDGQDGTLALGFSIGIKRFEVTYYPSYSLCIPSTTGSPEWEVVRSGLKPNQDGVYYRPGETAPFTKHSGQDGHGGWFSRKLYPDKWSYQAENVTAKHYEATALVMRDGETTEHVFWVNKPLCVDGWRFFIMDFKDTPHGRVVGLQARRDPGRGVVIAGIWLVIVGVAVLCWCRKNSSGSQVEALALGLLPLQMQSGTCGLESEAVGAGLVGLALPAVGASILDGLFLQACLGSSVIGYGVSAVLAIWGRRRSSFWVFCGAWLANLLVVLSNWLLCGHPPLGNMYHVLVVLSLCFLPQYLVIRWLRGWDWTLWAFALMSVFPLVGTLFMNPDLVWLRPPVLQSPWFVPHVLSYMISYATAGVAFVLTISSWFSKDHGICERRRLAGQDVLRMSLPMMTFGLWSGALWAEEAWGVYWSWDPKECWALVTWLLYMVSLHCDTSPRLRKWSRWAHVAGFAALLVTFLVVSLLPKFSSSLHSYAR